jgi:PAS domain S-box-containing protein
MKALVGLIKGLAAMFGSSFRKKALFVAIPGLIIASIVYTVDAVRTERAIMRQEIGKRAEVLAHLASRIGELPILSGNAELIKNAALLLKDVPEITFVVFYDQNMGLLARGGEPATPVRRVSSDSPMSIFEEEKYFDIYATVVTVLPKEDISMYQDVGPSEGTREKIGWVRMGFSKAAMIKAQQEIILRGSLFAVVLTAVMGTLVFVLFTIATKPLSALTKALIGVRRGEYPEINIKSDDEAGILAGEYNRMALAVRDRELRLVESEKKLRDLFDRVEHAIFRIDPEGRIVETNKKFIELCGSRGEFCSLFQSEQEGQRKEHALKGTLVNCEERLDGPDGKELIVMMSLYPKFDGEGGVLGFDGYFVDITEKKKLEESLMQAQKLDSLGLLAGGVAHDFNNILTGILGYASLVKAKTPEADPVHKYMETIEKSATRAAGLAKQLLGFARKGKYKIEKTSMNTIARELADFMKETFDRNITITLNTEDNIPLVEGDSTQLYQALLNLCINSRDAMPEGGRLFIKTEFKQLQSERVADVFHIPAGEYITTTVTDSGVGISPEVKKKIFDPFFTTKESGKGTGLGLAMVYGIIKNHGGYVDVYSEEGVGTTVRIYLPTAEGVSTEYEKFTIDPLTDKKGIILIIDDEEMVRRSVADILTAYSYEVLTANDGIEGVRVFQANRHKIVLVILDMIMPEMSGKQTFKEIREISPDIKVLLCSGYGQEQYFHELFEAGADSFLQKPFHHSELLRKVADTMGR